MSDGMNRDRPRAPNEHQLALGHAIDRAKLVILWERVWPRLVLFLAIFGGVLAVSWLGFWQVVPYWARFGGVLFVLGLLLLAALPLVTIRRPSDHEALRRIDRATEGGHRPATALADDLATSDDPFAKALWEEHRARVAAAAGRLRTGIPTPRMPSLDRYAIRALALLLIVPAYFLAGDERTQRLMTAFDWRAPPVPVNYRIDAWVTPPAYTARPPVILPTRRVAEGAAPPAAAAEPDVFRVPAGSVITLRVAGLADVAVKPEGGVAAAPAPERAADAPAPAQASQTQANLAETRWTISQNGALQVTGTGAQPLTWRFEAIADTAPSIAFERAPQTDQRNQFVLSYKVEDDYGVKEAEATLSLAPSALALQREGARPLAVLPPLPLTLPQARTRAGSGQTSRDFVAHPFAGLQVAVKLRAKDDAGNEGFSETVYGTLPARVFSKPVPRVLVEQRRILALDAHAAPRVARALEALTTAPDRFGMETPVYLGLRTAYFRLVRARNDAALRDVMDYLWDIAVRMEDGDVSEAERSVAQAAERLRQAIERGASEEEIRRLSQDLRQAMDRLMRELTEQALRNRQDGNQQQQQAQRDPNARQVRPQDLRDMLNRIENLARSGAREQAQRLMQELQQMLQGLQAGRQQQQQQGQNGEQGEQGEGPLDRLADMIRRQQQLRDDTFRRNQEQRRAQRGQQRPGQRGQPGQQGQQQPGQQGEQGEQGYGQLGDAQRELRELLDQLREQLGQQGEGQGQSDAGRQAQEGMGNAGRAMREAEEALGRGNGQGATDAQGRALRSLQQGAQGLAQQMQEGQGQGQGPGQPGQPGGRQGQAGNQDYDPLGRPTRGREANENSDVRVPNAGEGAAQRAQRVLEELRRRLSEQDRPQIEMDYIERLLRGLQIQ
ncbi:MAG: TIGR02302 family protein [Phreatobacter sp.]|nr:TIGR02302 family protein [Phreatobacter sp.]